MRLLHVLIGSLAVLLVLGGVVPGAAAAPQTFVVHLTAAEGSCPALAAKATGVVVFQLQDDGALTYRLVGGNIANVTAVHIHAGAPGVNGGVLIFLPLTGGDSGVLGAGTIPAAQVAPFLARLLAGQTYVNVHTTDCPAGLLRGQIVP